MLTTKGEPWGPLRAAEYMLAASTSHARGLTGAARFYRLMREDGATAEQASGLLADAIAAWHEGHTGSKRHKRGGRDDGARD